MKITRVCAENKSIHHHNWDYGLFQHKQKKDWQNVFYVRKKLGLQLTIIYITD